MRLKNKIAVVTGASSQGIGRAIAISYAKEGAEVFICSRNLTKLKSAAEEIRKQIPGAKIHVGHVDITSFEQVNALAERVVEQCGTIDILVNNAGILLRGPFLEVKESDIDRVFEVNVKGQIFCTQVFVKKMIPKKRGKVIMLSSEVAIAGLDGISIYGATKGAVSALTRHLAIELAPFRINVNAIAPGTVETDMSRKNLSNPQWREKVKSRFPLGRFAQPEDIVGAAVFLASTESDWMTGQTIVIDGGFTAG
ncbi:MAG: SDR family oxidoreductase [Deltaproteobacteria bacterium]|nr:SDR family oxidoreductase [Deltaproteobacteria bacterium]MBW1995805.1 SDR family oxidoreductase [Deltaproteobacteria bacterium]MBW2153044.1 SDR family oxidoreductase [Deltaproteobacteria bacterium]